MPDIRDLPSRWHDAYYAPWGMVKLLFNNLSLPEYGIELDRRMGDPALSFQKMLAETVDMVEGSYAAIGVPSEVERTGQVDLFEAARISTAELNSVLYVIVRLFEALNQGELSGMSPADKEVIRSWANVLRTEIEKLVITTVTPSVSYPDIQGSLYDVYPHLSFNPKPSIDNLETKERDLRDALETGGIDGVPWYKTLWNKVFEFDLINDLPNLEWLWDKLIQVVKTLAGYHSRIWYAIGYAVLNALWEDVQADMEV